MFNFIIERLFFMPYLVQGNADQFWLAAKKGFMSNDANESGVLEKELLDTEFLGSLYQAKIYLKKWQETSADKFDTKGNIPSGNLDSEFLFKSMHEKIAEPKTLSQRIEFTYVSYNEELCRLMLSYSAEDPTQWMVGLIKNTQKAPKDREIFILSSFDMQPYVLAAEGGIQSQSVDLNNNELVEHCDSNFIKKLVSRALNPALSQVDGVNLDLKVVRIKQLIRFLQFKNQQPLLEDPVSSYDLDIGRLFDENPALDLMEQYGVLLPFKILASSLQKNSKLCQEIGVLKLTDNEDINKIILQVLVRMLEKNYNSNLIQTILADNAYYLSFFTLNSLGLTQDIPELINQSTKCEELKYIQDLDGELLKKISLVFWAKGDFSQDEYETLVEKIKDDPLFSETLLALDKTNEIFIRDLYHLALDRKELQRQAILYRFEREFETYNLRKSNLLNLDESELDKIRNSFAVIKKGNFKDPGFYYKMILKNDLKGHKLRLFLPQFNAVEDTDQMTLLIDLLYHGVENGLISQGEAVKEIRDPELLKQAKVLHERFICVTHLYNLHFKEDVARFAAQETEKANRFRLIILKVEELTKVVKLRLLDSSPSYEEKKKWVEAIDEYRKSMYAIAFEGLTIENFDFKMSIKQTEKTLLSLVDPEIQSWLKDLMIVIANIVITVLTLGIANDIKEKNTGNYWFFNRTKSGEDISALDKEINSLIHASQEEKLTRLWDGPG